MEEQQEQQEERQIGKLLTLPYSEMTEEEIERVIEFKANKKAKEDNLKEALRIQEENAKKQLDEMQELIDAMEADFYASADAIIREYKETL